MAQAERRLESQTGGGDLSPLPARFLLIIIISAGVVNACGLWRPLVDRHDWGTAHQGQFGRNHVRNGLSVTQTRCMYSVFQQKIAEARKFYPDHPPLLSLCLGLSIAVFGANEVGVRMVPAASTVAAVALAASIAAGVRGRRYALWCAAVMTALPIVLYFGRTATHEQLVLPLWLLALRGYLGWTWPERYGRRRRRDATLFAAGTMLSILSGWVALLQAAVVWLHYALGVWRKRRAGSMAGWLLVTAPAALAAAITFTHILWTLEWKAGHLVQLFFYRSGIKEGEQAFTLWAWLARQAEWLRRDFTVTGLVIALVTTGALAATRFRRSRTPGGVGRGGSRRGGDRAARGPSHSGVEIAAGTPARAAGALELCWLIGAAGLLYVLVFRGASYVHEYWWLHAAPGMAMVMALGLDAAMVAGARRSAALASVAAVGVVAISMESAVEKPFFHHRRRIASIALEPCRFINEHAPPDAVVYGNRQFWAIRAYHEGPLRFLHPQISWYLDRMYVRATEEQALARVAPVCRFYLWLNVRREDRPLLARLRRMGTVLAEWPHAAVLDLTRAPQAGGGGGAEP
ncbi:MAG: hypothetical protein DCC65_16085 [Planctomycetota bacterium]|nr:MAG: hypothetical protein DCC65_16085 [Planctomycetota bacterium]